MAQVVLDELERDARIQEVRGDRVPQAVARVTAVESGAVAVEGEQRLDLALLKRAAATGEERQARRV
jgi:hypothetical protein